MTLRRAAGPALLLAAAFLVTSAVMPWSDESVSDIPVLQDFSRLFLDGFTPYSDVRFEYPPLAWPFLALAGLGGTADQDAFLAGLGLLNFAFALGGMFAAGRLTDIAGGDGRIAMYAWAAFPLLLGAIARNHFELIAAAPAVAGVLLVATGRPRAGLALIGAAAMVKPFALAAAPVALAWIGGRDGARAALAPALWLGGVLVAIAGVAVALSPDGAADAVTYHLNRPPQIESSPGILLIALDGPAAVREGFGSSGVASGAADFAVAAFSVLAALAVAALAYAASRRPDVRMLALAATTAVLVPAAFGKVGSPQFLVWAAPLMAVAAGLRIWPVALACAAAMLLTLAEFPPLYLDLIREDGFAVAVTGMRDAALVAACAASLAVCVSSAMWTATTGESSPRLRSSWPGRSRS